MFGGRSGHRPQGTGDSGETARRSWDRANAWSLSAPPEGHMAKRPVTCRAPKDSRPKAPSHVGTQSGEFTEESPGWGRAIPRQGRGSGSQTTDSLCAPSRWTSPIHPVLCEHQPSRPAQIISIMECTGEQLIPRPRSQHEGRATAVPLGGRPLGSLAKG